MRRLLASLFVSVSLCAALFIGCGAEPEPGGTDAGELLDSGVFSDAGAAVSFASDVQPIFDARCTTTCHRPTNPTGGLTLTPATSYGQLVDAPGEHAACSDIARVEPGAPTSSVLYLKVTGTTCGPRMPQNGTPLSAGQLRTIEQWIVEGAQNN